MNIEPIQRAFAELGARFAVEEVAQRDRRMDQSVGYTLDIREEARGQQSFLLTVRPERLRELDVQVLQKVRPERHLLLLVKREDTGDKNRFLCGFDEREWFVAATPGSVSTVSAARDSLKPLAVANRERWAGVRPQDRHKRHNRGSIRQGEWFFLPERRLVVPEAMIHRNEPISRGNGGKPHIVEQLYRRGGELVYVNRADQKAYTVWQMERAIKDRKAGRADFTPRRANAGVFARGKVSHPDHRTIQLQEWHQVVMNTENESAARPFLAFID
jgi:hypothetical protein